MDVAQRFWLKVDKNGPTKSHMLSACWVWTACRKRDGYGRFLLNNKARNAHRVSWWLHHGEVPPELCVLHRCDTPACVRPEHLFLDTKADNHDDMLAKGRRVVARGEKHGNAKLSDLKVQVMRFLERNTSLTHDTIGMLFGVNDATAQKAIRGTQWSHVGVLQIGGVS